MENQFSIARIFSDHMVLQREAPIPVWGWAVPGTKLSAEFNGWCGCATAAGDGRWEILLPAMSAGGPFELKISDSRSQRVFSDILLGDVWFASGQSNMEWQLVNSNNAAAEIASADYPKLRLFTVDKKVAGEPVADLSEGKWELCSPENAGTFSAVAFHFGKELQLHLDVPIGLIHSSWGGTPVDAWTSREMLQHLDCMQGMLSECAEMDYERLFSVNVKSEAIREEIIERAQAGEKAGVHHLEFSDSDWETADLPSNWNDYLPEYQGFVWFRKRFELNEGDIDCELRLQLGQIQRADLTYINGVEIGRCDDGARKRDYRIPSGLLLSGGNLLAVRVLHNWGGGGGLHSGPLRICKSDGRCLVDLAGEWTYKSGIEEEFPPTCPIAQKPYALYNAMVAPVIPYSVCGVIWYQGENNANPDQAEDYREMFAALINDWRIRWRRGFLPFIFVQLANFGPENESPEDHPWARLRESQARTLALPATGMAVTTDIGEADDIHPRNKGDVGKRLALAARHIAYGEDDFLYSGPIFRRMEKVPGGIILNFDFADGLKTADGNPVRGFAVAGEDRKFRWVQADILDETVFLHYDEAQDPVAVRYNWAFNPQGNLINSAELPAVPFRTDDWPYCP